MQCSTCETQLPAGVAHCPTCGSVTPYNISSSGVAPSDPTYVFTSYGDSAQHPYSPPNPHAAGDSAQHPYPPLNPYTAPTQAPPPPPRRRFSSGKMVLLGALVLLIVAAGGFFYFRTASPTGQPQSHPSPTAQTQQQASATPTAPAPQVSATPSAQTPQNLYAQVTQGSPALDDPLLRNDTNNWTESTSAGSKLSCAFTGGAYHASAQSKNTYTLCTAQATKFSDLAYQVQMTIVKGDFGGMVFRADSSQSKYYSFFIDRSGNYTLITSVDNTGTHDYVLRKGTSAFIKTGLNHVNTLAVVARGSNIYVYINQQYITSASDSLYQVGQIGVFGGNTTDAPADVVFSHVQVWNV